MTIKVDFEVDDAALEADIAQRMNEYNARTDTPVDLTAFAIKEASYALEQMRGASKQSLSSKVAQLKAEDLADVVAIVDAKLADIAILAEVIAKP